MAFEIPDITVNIVNCIEGIAFWAKRTKNSCPKEWKDVEDLEDTFSAVRLKIDKNLQIGNLVVVFDKKLKKFVRGKIHQIADGCEILAVDYGKFLIVPPKEIYEAPLHANERDSVKFQAFPILLDKIKPKDFDLSILCEKMKRWRSVMEINENKECYLDTKRIIHGFHFGEIRFIHNEQIVTFSSSLCEHDIAQIDVANTANNTKVNELMALTVKASVPTRQTTGQTRSSSSLNQNRLFVASASTSQVMSWLDEAILGPSNVGRATENSGVTSNGGRPPSTSTSSPSHYINNDPRDPVPILIRGPDKGSVKSINFQDLPLLQCVKDLLVNRMEWEESRPIQKCMMESILSNKDIVAVGEQHSGKSLGYIVPLSNLLYDINSYAEVSRYNGPLILVICRFKESIDSIVAKFKLVINNERIKILPVYSVSEEFNNMTARELINGADIVVANPTMLMHLIDKSPNIIGNFSRLCHLVIDEANFTFNKYVLLGMIKRSVRMRPPTMKPLQTICCSQYWTKDLEEFIKKQMKLATVIITSPFEAMLYGNVQLVPRISIDNQQKKQKIIKSTIQKYQSQSGKIVVSCSNERERTQLERFLITFVEILLPENAICSLTEAREFENQWKNLYGADAVPVFLTTDDILENVNITDADCVIKYSISSKQAFHKSLSCLYHNFLINGIDPEYQIGSGQSKPEICLIFNENLTECEENIIFGLEHYLRETGQDKSKFFHFMEELWRKKCEERRLAMEEAMEEDLEE